MAIMERNSRNIDNRYWNPGFKAFPVKNVYTAGAAGQRFFEEIKNNSKILGSRCEKCELTYVPARIYCERCFNRLEEKNWIDAGTEGTIYSYTLLFQTQNGEPRENPAVMVAVRIADGLLIHRLGEFSAADLEIGKPVKAKFKPKEKRKGCIEDIDYFKPIK